MADVAVRAAGLEDVEPTHEIIAACQVALYGEPQETIDHLRSAWSRWTRFTAREGMRLVGTSAVKDSDVAVFVRPEARRRGIGTRLLQAAERAVRADVLQAGGSPSSRPQPRSCGRTATRRPSRPGSWASIWSATHPSRGGPTGSR